MSPIRRLDAWLGSRLFVPVIVRVCQFTKWSQWKFASYTAMTFWMLAVARDATQPFRWFMSIDAICAFAAVASAGLSPDNPIPRSKYEPFFRFFALMLAAYFTLQVFAGLSPTFAVQWVFAVLYWYAKTIDTIPPAEAKKRAAKLARAAA